MKKLLIPIMLVIFMFQSTCNFWIIISFYANRDYIAENICINRFDQIPVCKGQCFLDEKLQESEKQEQKLPNLKVKEVQLFCEIATYDCTKIPSFFKEYPKPAIVPDFTLIKRLSTSIFHPPRLA